jgi:hypothetical protein
MVPPHFIFLRSGIFLLITLIYAKKEKKKEEECDIPLPDPLYIQLINLLNVLKNLFHYHINIA